MQAPSPTPSPPPHLVPPRRTNSPAVTHTHLGLRPKSPDSLHARIRSTHPQPKHISRIEDVVGGPSSGHAIMAANMGPSSSMSSGSFGTEPAYLGATSGVDAAYGSARQRRGLTSKDSREGSENGFVHSMHMSRPASPFAANPLVNGGEEGQGGRNSSVAGLSGTEDDSMLDDGDTDIETTDIGIYRDEVYDEYLGARMGAVRRLLIRSLRWESPLLARHQRIVRNRTLDRYFVYTSLMGSHSFFLIFLPMTYWFVNGCFARGLINVLAAGVYLSSAIKDALCIPRPYSPPVTRLVIGTTHLEYGFLSTHSTNCISIVLYVYLWLRAIREQIHPASPLQSGLWEAGLIFYAISVVYGRIYSGMHSIMDCVTGCVLGAAITMLQWALTDPLEHIMSIPTLATPLLVNSVGIIMVMVHPQPLDDCPCFEDAIAFLSVVMGIVTGRWAGVYTGLSPINENPLKRGADISPIEDAKRLLALNSSIAESMEPIGRVVRAVKEPALRASMTSPYIVHFLTLVRIVLVLVLGVGTVMATRVTVKTICRVILPPIFRFVQGTLGFILPRRHYTSSTDYAAMRAGDPCSEDTAAAQKPSEKGAGSGGHAHPTSSSVDAPTHKRNASWVPRATTGGATSFGARSRSHSLQESRAQSGNQVKFTLGDGKDLPVPFTHPNTHLPGDDFSERIAGALSAGERARQQYEAQGGGPGEVNGSAEVEDAPGDKARTTAANSVSAAVDTAPAGSDKTLAEVDAAAMAQDEIQIRHYDVDVLTKVFVYNAIGFVSSFGIPLAFERIGLL